ncbi:hypothetical protein [Streptomyces sp. WG7]|uniref:hypothetical protein n=1 Tax=Streptomyces sp. WG7 TaxID=3417650 RepID=UPI003CECAFDC
MSADAQSAGANSVNILEQLDEQLRAAPGIGQFTNAADRFVRGEISKEEATEQMMSFLRGDISDRSVERERLLELAADVQPLCGTVSITILTLTSCSVVLSCFGC